MWCDNSEWQMALMRCPYCGNLNVEVKLIYKMFFFPLDPELMLDQSFAKDRQKKDNHNMSEYLILISCFKTMLEVPKHYIDGYHNTVVSWLIVVLILFTCLPYCVLIL